MQTALCSFMEQYEEAGVDPKYVTLHAEEHIIPGSKAAMCMSRSSKRPLSEEQDCTPVTKKTSQEGMSEFAIAR